MEEVHSKLSDHERELARQGQAIESLVTSTNELREVVASLPEKINQGLRDVYRKLDETEQRNKPQARMILMTGAFIVSVFSVILTLIFSPLTNRVYGLESTISRVGETATRLEGSYRMCNSWNTRQQAQVEDVENIIISVSEDVSALQAETTNIKTLIRDIDTGGSRKWIAPKVNPSNQQ